MYTLRSIARRGTLLGTAAALVTATVIPAATAFADALNPLTDRSLTLSSAAPGWDDKDGSGNTTYAPPNSGANGQKTGNTFDFKVSTDTETGSRKIEAITFQYCTTPAGNCKGPGNNPYNVSDDARLDNGAAGTWDDFKSDLNVVTSSPGQATFGTYVADDDGATNPDGIVSSVPTPSSSGSNFLVYYLDDDDNTWKASTGWTMTASNVETGSETTGAAGGYSGANNQINLVNSNVSGLGIEAGTRVKIVFFGKDANYITNPGADEFFVRINTYDHDSNRAEANVIDGGVTVANVMNQSIQITTKVLETMDFSVGTVDPYTLNSGTSQFSDATGGLVSHSICDPVAKSMNKADTDADPSVANTLQLGDEDGEFSLKTDKTYSTHSYWRLSSNSSGGATVYYSGVTLSNTVGDKIAAIGDEADSPQPGSEQFGLALDNGLDENGGTNGPQIINGLVSYAKERTNGKVYQNGDDNAVTGIHASVATDINSNPSYHAPGLYSMTPAAEYGLGTGVINTDYTVSGGDPFDDTINTAFAFDESSNTIPVALAQTTNVAGEVVDCVTGKVRYIANIASTTPAGIYTTKINYIASPKY